MRIVHFAKGVFLGIAADDGSGFPGTLPELIAQDADPLRTGMGVSSNPFQDE
jgi:hypothetical protein